MSPCACHLVAVLLHSSRNFSMNLARLEAWGGARGDRRRDSCWTRLTHREESLGGEGAR